MLCPRNIMPLWLNPTVLICSIISIPTSRWMQVAILKPFQLKHLPSAIPPSLRKPNTSSIQAISQALFLPSCRLPTTRNISSASTTLSARLQLRRMRLCWFLTPPTESPTFSLQDSATTPRRNSLTLSKKQTELWRRAHHTRNTSPTRSSLAKPLSGIQTIRYLPRLKTL